jgi:hypothetical protein
VKIPDALESHVVAMTELIREGQLSWLDALNMTRDEFKLASLRYVLDMGIITRYKSADSRYMSRMKEST